MPIDRYFDKFPVISYSNNTIVDITRRVVLLDKVSKNPYVFYPYDIVSEERADQLSSRYYEDSYKSWLLYLSNKITDPYYEWYLTGNEFLEFIEKKYGSIYNSQSKVKFYRNDWENQNQLDVSGYKALPDTLKKYWEPNYNNGPIPFSYSRKQTDWSMSTNKILSYAVSNTNFIKDEIVEIKIAPSSTGKGQVIKTTNTHVIVQHVSGIYDERENLVLNNGNIFGTESLTNSVISNVNLITSNLSEEEFVYWKPITYYDHEYEKNEFNRSIRMIDKDQAVVAVNNLTELLSE